MRTAIQEATLVKQFLEIVQPLKVLYGYARGVRNEENFVTYQKVGTPSFRYGIGNAIISERNTYIVTVQTETAKKCMFYTELIKRATNKSELQFMSDDIRPDTTAKNRWINSIYIQVYNSVSVPKTVWTPEEVRRILQTIADRYIFVTSIYLEDIASSFIDKLVVPELDKEIYSYAEVLALKQQYIDKLLYTTTEY